MPSLHRASIGPLVRFRFRLAVTLAASRGHRTVTWAWAWTCSWTWTRFGAGCGRMSGPLHLDSRCAHVELVIHVHRRHGWTLALWFQILYTGRVGLCSIRVAISACSCHVDRGNICEYVRKKKKQNYSISVLAKRMSIGWAMGYGLRVVWECHGAGFQCGVFLLWDCSLQLADYRLLCGAKCRQGCCGKRRTFTLSGSGLNCATHQSVASLNSLGQCIRTSSHRSIARCASTTSTGSSSISLHSQNGGQ